MNNSLALAPHSRPVAAVSQPDGSRDMETELAIVRQALDTELQSLDLLLAYLLPDAALVSSHLLYTKIILAIGLPQHDTWRGLHQRCQLAIALELLGNALQVHHQMLVETPAPETDMAGPYILIGDFYFARAAQLVTQLGNPPLLDAFAHILKKISEKHLEHKALGQTKAFNAAAVLSAYGIRCGAHLQADAHLDADRIVCAWQQLPHNPRVVVASGAETTHPLLAVTPPHQHARWQTCSIQYRNLLDRAQALSEPSGMVI